jgi:hypothetical protein
MLLTPQELHELTDCARPSAQIEWLRARSWVFDVGVTGRPKVDRAEYERHMIGGRTIKVPAEREAVAARAICRLEGAAAGLKKRNERWRSRLVVYPLDQLRGLPRVTTSTNVSGVYFLWIGPLLWYIGQSRNVSLRIQQHECSKRFTHATYLPAHKDWIKYFEEDHVSAYHPRDNLTSHG